jgi:ABC-type nitrate/sulfonate/bicarbonate transport system permease component
MTLVKRLRSAAISVALPILAGVLVLALLRVIFPNASGVLPSPMALFSRFGIIIFDAAFWQDVSATLGRLVVGFIVSGILGALAGLLIGSSKIASMITLPALDFFRSLPVTTLYPVFIILTGIGDTSKVLMIIWAGFFVVAVNALYGVLRTNTIRRDILRIHGASRTDLFLNVTMPESLPYIFAGLRVSLSTATIVAILLEMFMGSDNGIGQSIMEFYSVFDMTGMFVYIFAAGILGMALNGAYVYFERRFVFWAEER